MPYLGNFPLSLGRNYRISFVSSAESLYLLDDQSNVLTDHQGNKLKYVVK